MFYRLKKFLAYRYFQHRTRGIHQSPPLPCAPRAGCEVHTMLGGEDLPLYLVAIKSLLRYHSALAVVVHNDGTLDRTAQDTLHRHVPGIRLVDLAAAEDRARRMLPAGSLLAQWRTHDVAYRRMVDTDLWSTTRKRFILDSDILVLRPPHELAAWIGQGETPFLMGMVSDCPSPTGSAPAGAHIQTVFRHRVGEVADRTGWPASFPQGATAGFYGVAGEELSLKEVERLLNACLELGLPMQHWGAEQVMILYLLAAAAPTHLPAERYINFLPHLVGQLDEACLVHFFGTHRFQGGHYPRLAAEAVADLCRPGFEKGVRALVEAGNGSAHLAPRDVA